MFLAQLETQDQILVPERDHTHINRPLDVDKSVDKIIAQASGLARL